MLVDAHIRVALSIDMTLAEALELEERLAGGEATTATNSLRRALEIQLIAARNAVDTSEIEERAS